jgi:hypothetical protein
MADKYNFYKDIEVFCLGEYGKRIINSKIIEKQLESVLWMQIDLGEIHYQEYDEVTFPKIDNLTYKFEKDYSPQHEVLNVYINSDRKATFYLYGFMPDGDYENDDIDIPWEAEVECFKIELKRSVDLKEIIDFISEVATNPKFNFTTDFLFKDVRFEELFDDIFVFIPHFSMNLLPFKNFNNKLSFQEINEHLKKLNYFPFDFNHKEIDVFENEGQEEFSNGIDEITNKIDKIKETYNSCFESGKPIEVFQTLDIGCSKESSQLFGYSDVSYINSERNLAVCIVFRLNKRTSNILFHDYIDTTKEGKKLIQYLFKGNLPEKIEYLTGRFAQIQYALEDRINRASILNQIKNNLLLKEENFKLRNSLTRKRLQYLNSFYSEQHHLIEMYENPLPFIIEKAYRDYVRSDVDMEMVTSGLHLLNILIKTRLFFPLEEYMLSDNLDEDFIKTIEQEFYNKKPSDGTFSRIHSILNKIISKNDVNLSCFGKFNEDLSSKSINHIFNEIVAIRNRFAHPPYDAKAFMDTLSHYIPGLIDTYRTAMADTDFLIPHSFKTKNKIIIMSAKKLMGFESKFETIEITISQDEILNFEVGEFIAYNSKTKKTVLLSKFIDLKADIEPKYNIGLFDGMENGAPVYR